MLGLHLHVNSRVHLYCRVAVEPCGQGSRKSDASHGGCCEARSVYDLVRDASLHKDINHEATALKARFSGPSLSPLGFEGCPCSWRGGVEEGRRAAGIP